MRPVLIRARFCVGLVAVAAWAARGLAVQATLVADAHVNQSLPGVNSGAISNLYVGEGYTSLLQFDLATLPTGTTAAQVSKAVLLIYCNRVDTAGMVSLQAVGSNWGEYSVTYSTLPSLGKSGGATQVFPVTQGGAYVALDVTAMVQGWVTAPATNFGVALTAGSAAVQFDSKENDLTGHAAELEVTLMSQGPAGATGAQGLAGVAGPAGVAGTAGATGPPGLPGVAGGAGLVGPAGAAGLMGPAGASGVAGAIGPMGLTGAMGAAGVPGAQGTPGPAGLVGPSGAIGPTGVAGPSGPAGSTGPVGAIGLTGAAGAAGPQGLTGATGTAGLTGTIGPGGPQGISGVVGATGAIGPAGAAGATGASGPMGAAGATGLTGTPGTPGVVGAVGATGAGGPAGAAGTVGSAGPTGPAGAAASVSVGTVTTGAAGTPVAVTNGGTSAAAVLNFAIPQGLAGLNGANGTSGIPFVSMYHAVSFSFFYYSVNTPGSSASEDATVQTWVPSACTATALYVYSLQGNAITVTLRNGASLGSMADTALSCIATNGTGCSATGNAVVATGSFLDLHVTGSNGSPSAVWTALACN